MVLTRRSAFLGIVLGVAALGACSESLFGVHPGAQGGHDGGGSDDGGGGGSDGGPVSSTCPSGCIADAGADFDGTANGVGNRWQYVEDHRNHTWTAMTMGSNERIGADAGNRITKCAANSTLPACGALPGALLVSTAGFQSVADPAIEFKVTTNQVIQLSLRALVPSGGADQTIRLYRNSREDALFTSTATAGALVSDAITLDAIAGDRFLVAVAPSDAGATNVGLQLFVNTTGAPFPSTCQLALPFSSASGANTVDDQCRKTVVTHYNYTTGAMTPTPVTIGMPAPFSEQGNAVSLKPSEYLQSAMNDVLDWSHDVTVQFWVQLLQLPASGDSAWLFSDQDPDIGGGLGIFIAPNGGTSPLLAVTACTDISQSNANFGIQSIPYPAALASWQFVRVVRSGSSVSICLNGQRMGSLTVNPSIAPMLKTFNSPALGIENSPGAMGAFFDGRLDDVRVFTGVLPCN